MKVLVACDNIDRLNDLSQSLLRAGFELAQAQTLLGTVRQIDLDRRIRLVIVDFGAEGTDGANILGMLKQSGLFERVEVIICSEVNDPKQVVKVIEMGAADYLVKPYDTESILARVGRLVEKIGRTVLIVDDEELMRGLLVRIVERDGYFSLTASSGEEALGILEANKVDVVLSDIVMPGMDGLQLLAKIKERWPELPVFLVTGYKNRFTETDSVELADGFLSKPFKNVEVLKQLALAMKHQHRRSKDRTLRH